MGKRRPSLMGVWTDTTGATPAQHSTLHHHSSLKLRPKTFFWEKYSTVLLTFALPTVPRLRNFGSIYFLSRGGGWGGRDSVSFGSGIFHLPPIVLHLTSAEKAQKRELLASSRSV